MEKLTGYMDIVQFILMIGAAVFAIFFYFSNPDNKAAGRISKIETECPLKHEQITYITNELKDSILKIERSLLLIQENDIKHIELELRDMSKAQTQILTILRERSGNNNIPAA